MAERIDSIPVEYTRQAFHWESVHRNFDGPVDPSSHQDRSLVPADSLMIPKETAVDLKTGEALIMAASSERSFRIALLKSGQTIRGFFVPKDDDISVQSCSMSSWVVFSKIESVASPEEVSRILDKAAEYAETALNGFGPDAKALLSNYRDLSRVAHY